MDVMEGIMDNYISLTSIKKEYATTTALSDINLSLPKMGLVFIKGKSGCGKTSLLNILGGLDEPTEGTMIIDNQETTYFDSKKWDDYRNRLIGFVFQDYNLLEGFTVQENIEFSLDIQDELQNIDDKKQRIRETLAFVGLEGFEKRKVMELSGGQKQRVAIARAIAKKSEVILADEPTGNLDSESGRAVLSLLKKVSQKRLVIVVTHDIVAALEYADRIITISDGKIIDDIKIADNDSLKHKYSIKVFDDKRNLLFFIEDKTFEKTKDVLASWLIEQQGTNTYSFEIQKNQCEPVDEINLRIPTNEGIKAKKLPISRCFDIALMNIVKKKLRLIGTIVMFSLMIFLLMTVAFVSYYDRTETISRYLVTQDAEQLYLFQNNSYENLFFERKENSISKGEKYYNKLSELFPTNKIIPRLEVDSFILQKTDESIEIASGITLIITDDYSSLDLELEKGRYPINENEVIITDYIAEYLFSEESIIGQTISVDNLVLLEVVGIIKTDCVENKIAVKAKRNDLNEFEQFDLKNVYQVAITGTGFSNAMKQAQSSIRLEKSNFFLSDMETLFLQSSIVLATQEVLDNELLYGRMPKSENEVLISSEIAAKEQFDESRPEENYYFLDIYDEKYNDTYIDSINLFDFFTDGVVVVGVYDAATLSIDYVPDVLINDAVYSELIDKNAEYYEYMDYMLIIEDSNFDELTKIIDSNGFMFNEPAIARIYQFQQMLDTLSSIIILFLVVIILITILMLHTYISNNIKVNAKKIGVLKAIGVTTNQLASIFLIEAIIISIVSYVISSILTLVFIYFVNNRFISQITGHEFEYLYWNWGMASLIFVLAILLSIFSSILPIAKMTRKKPVEIIRNNIF